MPRLQNRACAYAIHAVSSLAGNGVLTEPCLGGSNIFTCTPDAASLDSALRVDALVPGFFDEVLKLEDGGYPRAKPIGSMRMGADYIRNQHLDITISTKAACDYPVTGRVMRWLESRLPSRLSFDMC